MSSDVACCLQLERNGTDFSYRLVSDWRIFALQLQKEIHMRKLWMTSLLGFAMAFSVAAANQAAPQADCANESNYPEISKTELKQVAEKKEAFIIDVNSAESFKKAHVPGAVHFGTQKDKLGKLLPKDKNALVVAYCGGPMCDAWKEAAQDACKMGYKHVKHFKGGISGWLKDGA
jgi:rhodanese-related sulfurtransferase